MTQLSRCGIGGWGALRRGRAALTRRCGSPASLYAQEASGWRFDTGPSLLLFPDKYRECFEALGERMEDHIDVVRARSLFVERCHAAG